MRRRLNKMSDLDKYSCLNQIGKGTYGIVYAVEHKETKKRFALKIINLSECDTKEKDYAKNEVRILQKLDHRHLLTYHDSFEKDNNLHIVTEYCQEGCMADYIKTRQTRLTETECINFLQQICEGIQFLHDKDIIHRDIKPTNIFLTENANIKIGDLALAKCLDTKSASMTKCVGTPLYMSPEMMNGQEYTKKTDVWSISCCLYEMATTERAFDAKTMQTLKCQIKSDKEEMVLPYCQLVNDLFRTMFDQNPDERPSVAEVLIFTKDHMGDFERSHPKPTQHEPNNEPDIEKTIHVTGADTCVEGDSNTPLQSLPPVLDVMQRQKSFTSSSGYHSIDMGIDIYESRWPVPLTVEHEPQLRRLLRKNYLPTSTDINELCRVFGNDSELLKEVCNAVCEHIQCISKDIKNVWTGYRPGQESEVVFVVITNKEAQMEIDELSDEYEILLRATDDYSDEGKFVMYSDESVKKPFTSEEMKNISECLRSNTQKLFEEHSNIGMTSACSVKSKDYGKENAKLLEETCIVLYVHIKGIIPIGEKSFSKTLDGFPVDIREGGFVLFAKANEFNDPLKMGCAICGDNGQGTLGAFVDMEDGTYCITSGHVLLNDQQMLSLHTNGGSKEYNQSTKVFQPVAQNTNQEKFGELVWAIYKTGDHLRSGIDVALIKVTDRLPQNGRFPDCPTELISDAGLSDKEEMVYNSGLIHTPITSQIVQNVIKFGCQSEVTRGSFHLHGPCVRKTKDNGNHMNFKYELLNQYEILSIGPKPFAIQGDSGALVLIPFEGNYSDLRAIGIVEGGTSCNTYIVTPIESILEHLNKKQLKSFSKPDLHFQRSESGYATSTSTTPDVSIEQSVDSVFLNRGYTVGNDTLDRVKEELKDNLEEREQNIAQDIAIHHSELKTEMETKIVDVKEELNEVRQCVNEVQQNVNEVIQQNKELSKQNEDQKGQIDELKNKMDQMFMFIREQFKDSNK